MSGKPQYGVWRPVVGRVVIKMPYAPGNRAWLKDVLGDRIRPTWNKDLGRWEIARNHFGSVVEALADRLGRIDAYMDFTCIERCDSRCKAARSRECNCVCLGKNHGQGGVTHGWKLVSDTLEIKVTGVKRRHIVVLRGESV